MRIPEAKRFLTGLIAGVVIIDTFYLLQMAFPNLRSWYIPVSWWGLSVWLMFGGLLTGLIVGILALDLRRAVAAGLASVFLGPIIIYCIIIVALYFVGYDPRGYSTPFWMLFWSFLVSLENSIPAIIGSILGTLIMKEIINRTASPKRN